MKTIKNYLKNNLYGALTTLLATLFFIVGFFTLGSFSHTGKSYYLEEGTSAVFELELKQGQTYVKEIYVNLGAVHAEKDSEVEIIVKTSTSTSSSWDFVGRLAVTKAGVNDEGLFNWTAVATDMKKNVDVCRVSVSVNANVELNEIVCIADDGGVVPLKVAEYGNSGSEESVKKVANAFDSQKSFTKKNGSYYRFTKEEGVYLSYLRNLGLGSYYDSEIEREYPFAEDFGAVAVLAFAPTVAVFGNSVFALRLPSLIAATFTLVFLSMLFNLLFKNEKYGFFGAVLCVVSGIAVFVGRLGAPYSFVACAIVGATYFAYKFFAKGISASRICLDGLNVVVASLLCAVAVSMETIAIFPALGVFGLLGLGVVRQKKAHGYALERVESVADEEKRKMLKRMENISYSKKSRMVFGGVALGFVVFYFFLIFLSSILCHNAYARAYGEQAGFALVLWKNISAGFRADVSSVLSQNGISLAWFLPIASLKDSISWVSIANLIISCLALISLVYCAVIVIKNRKATDKESKRVSRIYGVCLFGTVIMAISALVKGVGTGSGAFIFYAFYYGFILLCYYCLFEKKKLGGGEL